MRTKATILVILCVLLSFMAVGMAQAAEPIGKPIPDPRPTGDPIYDVEVDQNVYQPGETVTITITNIGTGTGYHNTCTGFPWNIYRTAGDELVREYQFFQCGAMDSPFPPGTTRTYTWDQTYLLWEDNEFGFPNTVPPTGEQVPNGQYYVKLGNPDTDWWVGNEAAFIIAGPPANKGTAHNPNL